MRISSSVLIVALLGTPVAARAPSIDKMLAGRTPGEPTSCIQQNWIDQTTISDSGSILYQMKSGPDYLNTPSPICSALRSNRGLVSRTPTTSLCRGDILSIVDFTSGTEYGSCGLGDFVPYPHLKMKKKPQ
jgi:hypothetical protein